MQVNECPAEKKGETAFVQREHQELWSSHTDPKLNRARPDLRSRQMGPCLLAWSHLEDNKGALPMKHSIINSVGVQPGQVAHRDVSEEHESLVKRGFQLLIGLSLAASPQLDIHILGNQLGRPAVIPTNAQKDVKRNSIRLNSIAFPCMQLGLRRSSSTGQDSTARHGTAQHSTAQHSTAQHSTAQHSTAQHTSDQLPIVDVAGRGGLDAVCIKTATAPGEQTFSSSRTRARPVRPMWSLKAAFRGSKAWMRAHSTYRRARKGSSKDPAYVPKLVNMRTKCFSRALSTVSPFLSASMRANRPATVLSSTWQQIM
ncbi:MAG: DNA methylase [Trebouxia sp. A1-2]|nr:MAG: DNA methylase [Trebouxia sp. A1-2]